jgi:hypothetical protein
LRQGSDTVDTTSRSGFDTERVIPTEVVVFGSWSLSEEGDDGETEYSETPETPSLQSHTLGYVSFTEVGITCRVVLREPMYLYTCVSEEGGDGTTGKLRAQKRRGKRGRKISFFQFCPFFSFLSFLILTCASLTLGHPEVRTK